MPTSSLLLPRTVASPSAAAAAESPPHVLLLTSPTGHVSALTTLPEPTHRRLLSLSGQMLSSLPSTAGLGAKAHRMPGAMGRSGLVGVDTAAGRSAAVVDAAVLAHWSDLATARRAELASRSGYDGPEDTRAELQGVLGWTGMAYF